MESYGAHLFTPSVRAEQDRVGSGQKYEMVYRSRNLGDLDPPTRSFIESCTSFYMASISSNGWPYLQHRGGPAGFLKILGPDLLGFADYRGNEQFISKGNLRDNDRVALFLMDYPRRARLKLIGHATMIDTAEDADLARRLAQEGAPRPERLATIQVVALDWNCPKYITPRLSEAEIEAIFSPRIQALGKRIEDLEARLDRADPNWRDSE